jgi:transposase InsO family protein
MEQRLDLIREYGSGLLTMTELAAQYGVSPKTAYKWLARYAVDGAQGLCDRSRRPHHSPQATAAAVMEAVIACRRRHPHWGAKKLLAFLRRRQPALAWPGRSTVCDQLKARGLVTPRKRRLARSVPSRSPVTPAAAPNDVWTTDFKGEFRTGDGYYCYPLTVRDAFSRFVLRCDALTARTLVDTRRAFERAFATYGLPTRLRSDNGGPFASPGLGGLSRLSVWWIRLGIVPERIAPGHPEQNGSHEQFHAVLKTHTTRPPAATARAQQRRFAAFCTEYNHERPHEALHDDPPAVHYHASPQPFPRHLPALEYPGHTEVRRVSSNGCVSWGNDPLFLTTALAGESVAFEEVDDGVWTVRFADVVLGRFDERQCRIHPLASWVRVGRSASSAGSAPAPPHTR